MSRFRNLRRIITVHASQQEGFTLIEVLVSTVIFAIGALGVVSMLTLTIRQTSNGRAQIEATSLAEFRLEQLQTSATAFVTCVNGALPSVCYTFWDEGATMIKHNGATADTIGISDIGAAGSANTGIRFQMTWGYSIPRAGLRHYVVDVSWPRNHDARGANPGTANFIDCGTNPGLCHTITLHSYRKG